jgi:serine/threonine protein kinase
MPIIDGRNICDFLSGAAAVEVVEVFLEVLRAVGHAHSLGIIHRDLKPSNILVRDADRQPVVLDFGCAYLLDDADDSDLTTTLIGTSAYVPPEVIRNPKNRDVRQDVYACGILLYQVMCGCLPDPDEYQTIGSMRGGTGVDESLLIEDMDGIIQDSLARVSLRMSTVHEMCGHLEAALARQLRWKEAF